MIMIDEMDTYAAFANEKYITLWGDRSGSIHYSILLRPLKVFCLDGYRGRVT